MIRVSCWCSNAPSLLETETDNFEYFRDIHSAYAAIDYRAMSAEPWIRSPFGFDSVECKGVMVSIRLDHGKKMVEELERKHIFDDVGAGYHQLKSQIERVEKGIR